MNYTGTFDGVQRDELFGGTSIPVSVRNINISSDTSITRGAILSSATETGNFALATDSDTSKILAVAACDFTATSDNTVTQAYTSGVFNRERLTLADGSDINKLADTLRKDGIILTSIQN